MQKPKQKKARTSGHSISWDKTGIARLYKRVGSTTISFIYKHRDGRSQTLSTVPISGTKQEKTEALILAQKYALDLLAGKIHASTVQSMIERFVLEVDPVHYLDQSKTGISNRRSMYANLIAFFGKMSPDALRTQHGYQFLEARSRSGAPARANKEISSMSTICHYAVRWGLIERNPFINMMMNKTDKSVRTITRSQIVRFYLWSIKQNERHKILGCAAMFTYLTGFRSAEVRPFKKSGLQKDGVLVVSAKRKKGEQETVKLREWSPRLKVVVRRSMQRTTNKSSPYLFAPTKVSNAEENMFTKSGWSASWQKTMLLWISSIDPSIDKDSLISHPLYFSLQDIRPAAITSKIQRRDDDVYDFAAHSNPSTTHKHYDRRRIKKAKATE